MDKLEALTNQLESKMISDLKKLNGIDICHHPIEHQIKNKLGMVGCTLCNKWITPYNRKY